MGSPESNNYWSQFDLFDRNWSQFDYAALINDVPVPDGNLAGPCSEFFLSSPPINAPSVGIVGGDIRDSSGEIEGQKEPGSKKRVRSEACSSSSSKACQEKLRRDRLNDRFLELGSILDPGRPPKTDKAVILADAIRKVRQLQNEAEKWKDSNSSLQEKIEELKAERNELHAEKQKLRADKEKLEQQLKAINSQPSFMSLTPAIPAAFATAQGQAPGSKLVPLVGYPSVAMWQFVPPAAVDTSQDHMFRPPAA